MVRLRYIFLFIILIFCVSCASTTSSKVVTNPFTAGDEEEYRKLFELYNSYNGSVCMGISGPYTNKPQAVEEALSRCLQYLAFYRGLAIETNFGFVVDPSGNEKISSHSVVGGTTDRILEDTADDMEIVDVVWLGGKIGAVVFARLPEMEEISQNKLELSDYVTAYATSEKVYTNFADAIEAATFRATQALLSESTSAVNVDNVIVETTSKTYRRDNYSISGLRMSGFVTLNYDYKPEEGKVYALVVCKQ